MKNLERFAMFFGALVIGAVLATCATQARAADWSKPGANPFLLSVPDAVNSYHQIPLGTRHKLWRMMEIRQPTDTVVITRDTIKGAHEYTGLRDMHWGRQAAPHPGPVDRSSWGATDQQRAFVYCADGWCVIVPFICRNVALVDQVVTQSALPPGPVVTVEAPPLASEAPGESFQSASEPELVAIGGGAPVYVTQTVWGGASLLPYPVAVAQPVPSFPDAPGHGVPVSPVPEPETWAMMAAGLLLLVFAGRRQRGQAASQD